MKHLTVLWYLYAEKGNLKLLIMKTNDPKLKAKLEQKAQQRGGGLVIEKSVGKVFAGHK